jgi:hypothetical protein
MSSHGSGGDVRPDLSKIGGQQKRDYLLEASLEPNLQIAKGGPALDQRQGGDGHRQQVL